MIVVGGGDGGGIDDEDGDAKNGGDGGNDNNEGNWSPWSAQRVYYSNNFNRYFIAASAVVLEILSCVTSYHSGEPAVETTFVPVHQNLLI